MVQWKQIQIAFVLCRTFGIVAFCVLLKKKKYWIKNVIFIKLISCLRNCMLEESIIFLSFWQILHSIAAFQTNLCQHWRRGQRRWWRWRMTFSLTSLQHLTCRALECRVFPTGCAPGRGSRVARRAAAAGVLLAPAVFGAALVVAHCSGSRLDAGVWRVVGLLPLCHLHHAVRLTHCGGGGGVSQKKKQSYCKWKRIEHIDQTKSTY